MDDQATLSRAGVGVDDLLAIVALARTASGFRSPAETAELVGARVAAALGYDEVVVALAETTSPPLGEEAWRRVLEAAEAGLATTVPDLAEGGPLDDGETARRGAVFVPLLARGRLAGVLCGFHREPRMPADAEVELFRVVARVAGVAVDLAATAAGAADPGSGEGVDRLAADQATMTQLAVEPSGDAVHAICQYLASRLGASVLLWDVSGEKTRAFSGSAGFRSAATELLSARDPARLARVEDGATLGPAVAHPIGRERTLGLLLVERDGEGDASRSAILRHAVALLAFDLEAERAERTARNVSRPSILHALVSGRLSPRQAVDVGTFVDATGQALRVGFLCVEDDVVATATSHRVNFSARSRGCLAAAAERDGVLLLVEDAEPDALRSTIRTLLDSVSLDRWSLGLSEPFLDLADAERALEQAHIAASSAGAHQIALHDEMGATVSLLKYLEPGAAARYVDDILRPLVEYDRTRNGALVETLSAYLRHSGSLRKAAEELFVHSNTVQLRLARAAQLTGIDLHDLRQLGMLSLAFVWRGEPEADRAPAAQ